jgi:hypothetical protein
MGDLVCYGRGCLDDFVETALCVLVIANGV